MKKIMIGAVVLLMGSMAWAQKGISFFHGSFAEAQNMAAEKDQLIFMDSYATWCGPCKRLSATSFKDSQVGKLFNDSFVNLKMDMEKGEGPRLARIYQVQAYPTLFILDSEGEVLDQIQGAPNTAQLLAWARAALEKHGSKQTNEEPYKGSSDEEAVPEETDLAESETALISPVLLEDLLKKAVEERNRERFMSLSEKVLESNHPEKKLLFLDSQRDWAETTGKTDDLVINISMMMDRETEHSAYVYNDAAWFLFQKVKDQDILLKAAGWAEQSMKLDPAYYNHDTFAQLMYAGGEVEVARNFAEKAIQLAKKDGVDASDSEILLAKIKEKQ